MSGDRGHLGDWVGMVGHRRAYEEFRLDLENNGNTLEGMLAKRD